MNFAPLFKTFVMIHVFIPDDVKHKHMENLNNGQLTNRKPNKEQKYLVFKASLS